MPLENRCSEVMGNEVFCLPIYGNGWNAFQSTTSGFLRTAFVCPPGFRVRVAELCYHAGDLKGGIGCISESGHALEGEWLSFLVRDGYLVEATEGKQYYNFSNHIARYNLTIGSARPVVVIDYAKPMIEWSACAAERVIHGFGYVSDSDANLNRYVEAIRLQAAEPRRNEAERHT